MAVVNEAANVGEQTLWFRHAGAEDSIAPTGTAELIITSANTSAFVVRDMAVRGLSSIGISAHTPTIVLQCEISEALPGALLIARDTVISVLHRTRLQVTMAVVNETANVGVVLTGDRGFDCHAYDFELHAPAARRISPRGTDLRSTTRDLECVTSCVCIDTIAQMSCIIGALDCKRSCDAPAVVVAVADENKNGRSHTRHFEMHAPTAVMVQASGTHPAAVNCDLELVVSLVGVDPVAQVS
jgi:hypothetical protein